MTRDCPELVGFTRNSEGVLCVGGFPLEGVLAKVLATHPRATPAYVYDLDGIEGVARSIVAALGGRGLCAYAIKANGARPIVKRILRAGCGVDVVSGGELRVALACGAQPQDIVYSGVAKRDDELEFAIASEIRAIHAESVEEIERVVARANALGKSARVALRINPAIGIDEVNTHAHIATGHDEAKFGIAEGDLARALRAVDAGRSAIRLVGLSVHIGSQVMTTEPYVKGVSVLCRLAKEVESRGFALDYLDSGGGFGIAYASDQNTIAPAEYVHGARAQLSANGLGDRFLLIEPGRALVGAHGILVSRVIQEKRSGSGDTARRWLLIDAGMNDLIRPALYQAHHRIEPLTRCQPKRGTGVPWRIAGPVCESSDDFGVHELTDPPPALVAIRDVGAYGQSMASNYNARPFASEVYVSNGAIESMRLAQPIDDFVMARGFAETNG